MRKLAPPPDFRKAIMEDPHVFERLQPLMRVELDNRYLHWDKLRHLEPPAGYSSLDWWTAIKIGRISMMKVIDLKDCREIPLLF